jgi:transcriptional regulator with XRE-family HTH domain
LIGEGGAPGGPQGIGESLRRARINHGYSLHALAHELKISAAILEAVETESWERIPPGRERPTTRQIADFLEIDLAHFPEQWRQLPGSQESEPRDPRQEKLERILMAALTLGCAGLLVWLVVPGRRLGRTGPVQAVSELRAGPAPWIPKDPAGPYPVVGEVLPEAPVTEDGVLVLFRAVDACTARITGEDGGPPQERALRVSEPWRLRVKGAFSISLDNAGVVALEVAGRRIRHGRNVGEPWSGAFRASGEWLIPEDSAPKTPPTAPETDPITQEVE